MFVFYSWWTCPLFMFLIVLEIVSVNKENEDNSNNRAMVPTKSKVTASRKLEPTNSSLNAMCPKGFTYFNSSEELCYILIKDKHPYPPRCPYQNSLAHDFNENLYKMFQHETLWVRAYRYTDRSNISPFTWTEPSRRYGDVITDYLYNSWNIYERNCMTILKGTLRATNCSENHRALCIYALAPGKSSRYCTDRTSGMTCINTDINIDSGSCYCQNIKTTVQSRSRICEKLAEPRNMYQSFLISKNLSKSYTCYFGLYKDRGGTFRWSSDSSTVGYRFWSKDTNFNKNYGAIQYNTEPRGWILTDDNTLKCGICETSLEPRTSSIFIHTFSSNNFLTVIVRNPAELSNYFGQHYMLFCFSNKNINGFVEKILTYIPNVPTQSDQYHFTLLLRNPYPALYWCEGFSHPNMTPIRSNSIIAFYDYLNYRSNYAIHLYIWVPQGLDPFRTNVHIKATNAVRELTKGLGFVLAIRPIQFIVLHDEYLSLLLHLSTVSNNYTLNEETEVIRNSLENIETVYRYIHNVTTVSNTYVCLESTSFIQNITLTWPQTTIGSTVISNELCLHHDGTPITRTCNGNYAVGGEWSEVSGVCATNITYPDSLKALHALFLNTTVDIELDDLLLTIVKNISKPMMVELHLISQLLNIFLKEAKDLNITTIVNIVNALLNYDHNLLKQTQLILNSTDAILDTTDRILSSKTTQLEDTLITTDNLIVQIESLEEVRGLALYSNSSFSNFRSVEPILLYENTSEEFLFDENIQAAVFVPNSTYAELLTYFGNKNTTNMIVTFFSNHRFFNSNQTDDNVNNIALSILIPGLSRLLSSPIIVMFNSNYGTLQSNSCAYWDYGLNDQLNNIKGRWKVDDFPTKVNDSRVICYVNHLTHFSMLVIGSDCDVDDKISITDEFALEIITIAGSVLSYVGLLSILITALLFKRWRRHSGNTIILQFSICLTTQMSLTFVASNVDRDGIACTIAAALLHYFIISEFCWMMVIAFLQYRKFVTVFNQPTSHLVAKASLFGWLFPLLPVIIPIIISPNEAYQKNSLGLCYPINDFYIYGVVVPIGILVTVNFTIFFLIMKNVCSRKIKAYGAKAKDMKLQFLLAFLLFFLLGISWAFGLLTALKAGIFFAYLFCITVTMQGFVMFIFFIIMNDNARSLWMNMQKHFRPKEEDTDAQRKASAHFSTTSVSTLSGNSDESKPK